jgi:hypothetical protein
MPYPKTLGLAIVALDSKNTPATQTLDESDLICVAWLNGHSYGKRSKSSIAQAIRDAAINWPQFLGSVECEILDFAFNGTGEGFMHMKMRENKIQARTYMLFVAEALES